MLGSEFFILNTGKYRKESACQCRRCGFDLWVGKIPWRRKWQPTPVFLPGKSHAGRSLLLLLSRFSRVRFFPTPWTVVYPSSSVHGIFQARVLEWVAISFSRGSFRPRDRTQICICRQILCLLSHQGSWLILPDFLIQESFPYQLKRQYRSC